jgi:hypothetical protein
MSLVDVALRLMDRHGETMVLHRSGHAPITLKGVRIPGSTEEAGGSARQQRFKLEIGVTELAASAWLDKVPNSTDTIDVAGRNRTIDDVTPLSDGDVVGLYRLEVFG